MQDANNRVPDMNSADMARAYGAMGFETVVMKSAKDVVIVDLESLKKAKGAIERYQDEVFSNLMLEEDEVEEYYACIGIVNKKIDEFIKNNPEYGI